MPLSNAEEEVRNILDEAISASITASTPGISWGKLMTIIQMQRPLVDEYVSQRRKVQPIREVNIGDSVNPFRAEIVKLICALQLTGRFGDTNTTSRAVTRTNNRVVDPYEVSLRDNCLQSGHEITVSKKCKNTKWGAKHFGKGNKMHEVSEEKHLLNTYNDATGGQNCGPFSFTFNVPKESHKTDQLNEPNIDTTTYRNDYNSYLIARYESEYGDVNLLNTTDGKFPEVRDEEEEAQYAEHDMYEPKKSSSDQLCMYSKNKSENHTASSSLYDSTSQELDNGIHCDQQTSGQGVAQVTPHYHPETCETGEKQSLGANLSPTYPVICANSSSEFLAQISRKNATDYIHDIKEETNEQKESLSEVTDSKSVCELYRMKEKSYCYTPIDSASKGNGLNNKIVVSSDELLLQPVAGSPSQHAMGGITSAARDSSKKCSSPARNTAEYLFQNFLQPEEESNIQMLLEHNLSSGHGSPHCRSTDEINTVLDCTLEDAQENQRRPESKGNVMDSNEKTGTSILKYSSQITKKSCDSLNAQETTVPSVGSKDVLQEFQQVNDFQEHLNNTSSTNTTVNNCISTSYVDTADYKGQNKNTDGLFSNKKVYWSSVGLIIEDLIDSNVLPVAGHSDMTLGEPQDSKADKESSTLCDDGRTRDQITDTGNTNYSRPGLSTRTEDSSFITEPDVKGSTDLMEKESSLSGKFLSEDTSAESKNTKKSQQKRSFFKSLQRVFHFSRKH